MEMSEILLYVKEELSCSVTLEEEDLTVESFWKNVLTEIDDILNFPYKFTRLVNNKRVVVGAKQEPGMKVTRCFDINADEKAIHLVREKPIPLSEEYATTMEATASFETEEGSSEESNMRAESTNMRSLAPKRTKVSCQPTILDFASGQSIRQKVKSDAYSAARARKVKVFSESKIEGSKGLQKIYRMFWNEKAEEICSNTNLTTFKPGEIQGAINVAWTLEKTQHLKEDMEKLQEETGQSCNFSNAVLKKFQSSNQTIEKNSERLESAHAMLSKTQDALKKERFELFKCSNGGQRKIVVDNIEKQGNELKANVTELRRAQDALRKALHIKRKLLDNLTATNQ